MYIEYERKGNPNQLLLQTIKTILLAKIYKMVVLLAMLERGDDS
ncbi:hypothetical protein [Peribacillus phoenicis]